jgi:hypothetical protein
MAQVGVALGVDIGGTNTVVIRVEELLLSALPTGNAAVLGASVLIWNELCKQQIRFF